jgi:hypothetical protein
VKTKDCPSCGEEVPKVAYRCKHCFHDFDAPAKSTSWAGPIALLVSFAAMAVVGAVTLFVIVSRPIEERILVDQDTKSVIWTTQYRTGITTDRLMWSDIISLEYALRNNGTYAVRAITTDGDRRVIHEGTSPLTSQANQYAELMGKDLAVVDETTGFHKSGQ